MNLSTMVGTPFYVSPEVKTIKLKKNFTLFKFIIQKNKKNHKYVYY